MTPEIVPLITTDDTTAHIIAGSLESQGIRCFISSDAMTSVFPLPDSSIGTVTVSVYTTDLAAAEKILASDDSGSDISTE